MFLTKKIIFAAFILFSAKAFSKTTPVIICDTAFAGNDQNVCADTTTITGNTPQNGTGAWTLLSGTGTITNNTSPSTTLTALGTGTNVFVWTITGGGCPTVSDTVSINVGTPPTTAAAGMDQEICTNTVTLAGNAPTVGTGQWIVYSGSGTITSPTSPTTSVTNLGVGPNTLRWKISNGFCNSTDDVVITRDSSTYPANAGVDQSVCSTSCFLGGNTPPYGSGTWTLFSGTATITNSINSGSPVTGMIPGDTAFFVWTLTNGVCPASSDTAYVYSVAPPTTAFCGPDQTICSSSSLLSANLPSTGTGMWTIISGSASITNAASQNSPVSAIAPDTTVFVWTITNGICPASTDTLIIYNVPNPSTPNAGPDQTICSLSSVFAATTPTTGTGMWSLISGSGNIVSPSSPTSIVSNLVVGQNLFAWTTSNGICPSASDTVIITVDAPSTNANAGTDFFTCGSSAMLSGSSPANGTGTWSVLSGSGSFSLPNSGSTNVNGLTTGANTFVWTIVNGVCPASSDTVTVTSISPASLANAGSNQEICTDSTSLNASAPLSGSGTWSIVTAGPSLSSASATNPAATNLVLGQNIFVWTVANGICPPTDDSVVITVDQVPTIADAGLDIFSTKSLTTLSANVPVVGTGIWNDLSVNGNILSPLDNGSSFIVTDSGTFVLTWTITNGVCPASVDTVVVHMDFIPIPEVITPNGDGENDYFVIRALEFTTNVKLSIYNRWGGLVFSDDNYKQDFDGKNNSGVELAEDTYFYQVQANGVEKFKGYLLIKRK